MLHQPPLTLLTLKPRQPLRPLRDLHQNMEVIIHHHISQNLHPQKRSHPPHHPAKGLFLCWSEEKFPIHRSRHQMATHCTVIKLNAPPRRRPLRPPNRANPARRLHLRQLQRRPRKPYPKSFTHNHFCVHKPTLPQPANPSTLKPAWHVFLAGAVRAVGD